MTGNEHEMEGYNYNAEDSETKPLLSNSETMITPAPVHRGSRNTFVLVWFAPVTLVIGICRAVPLAVILPESIKLGLTKSEAATIVAAQYFAICLGSFLDILFQRMTRGWKPSHYVALSGALGGVGYYSFYFAHQMGRCYLYLAVLARILCGIAINLICNKIAVGWTIILDRDVAKSSMAYESFVNVGKALGAYLGTVLVTKLGFSVTMATTGLVWVATAGILILIFPEKQQGSGDKKRRKVTSLCKLYFTLDTLIYGWIPMLSIGGCVAYVEAILTKFYTAKFSKSSVFGGSVLGVGSLLYSVSTAVVGLLGVRFPFLQYLFLVVGLAGAGITNMFLGPVLSVDGIDDIIVSAVSFNIMLICASAIQYASLTLTARKLSQSLPSDEAMSAAMKVFMMGFCGGAVLGPVVAASLLDISGMGYREVFTVGTPIFLISSLAVVVTILVRRRWPSGPD